IEPPVAREEWQTTQPLHGPSILGLGDAGETDYLFEEESSHGARRALLALILLVVAVLFLLQWRGGGQFGLRAALDAMLNRNSGPVELKPNQPAQPETAVAKPQADSHSDEKPADKAAATEPASTNKEESAKSPERTTDASSAWLSA